MHHYYHPHNQLNSYIYSQDKSNFCIPRTKRPLPFLTRPTQKLLCHWIKTEPDWPYLHVGQTKNLYITVSTEQISSTHKLIQQILGSHELNGHVHFRPHPPKNHWNYFYLSWICTYMQKVKSFHLFILEIKWVLEFRNQAGHTHLWPCLPPNFLINF